MLDRLPEATAINKVGQGERRGSLRVPNGGNGGNAILTGTRAGKRAAATHLSIPRAYLY